MFLVLSCAQTALCRQSSYEAKSENGAPTETSSCGCEKLKRAAGLEPSVEEESGEPLHPAVKYSEGVNNKLTDTQGNEKTDSQVVFCYIKFSLHLINRLCCSFVALW